MLYFIYSNGIAAIRSEVFSVLDAVTNINNTTSLVMESTSDIGIRLANLSEFLTVQLANFARSNANHERRLSLTDQSESRSGSSGIVSVPISVDDALLCCVLIVVTFADTMDRA